jgi:hypothetical protein
MFPRVCPVVCLVTSALFGLACNSDCGEAGCVPGVFVDGTVETQSQRLRADVCLAGRCASADVDLAAGTCKKLTLSSDARICFEPGGPGRLAVSLEVRSIGGELAFNDGDQLTLGITDRDSSALVANVDENLVYQAEYPNGPDCDDQPCRAASVTF